MLQTALRFSHDLLTECIVDGDVIIDATMGNGHDTLFLKKLLGNSGHLYSFDIQKEAITSTKKRLEDEADLENVSLIHQGHETIDDVLPLDVEVGAAIFNLGYLPRGNKDITTTKETTLIALEMILSRLRPKGRVVLVLYSGHDSGMTEKDAVLDYAKNLSQEVFSVLTYQFINQKNNPPSLICIEKKKI